ncbi:hypothetical protein [Flavobacterium sp.]|jgi:hypothetical protein|uniref:hypothetical protein n=1 Tax=Flavobacterium sp. TaxID=239 RepID=UPI0037BFD536
MKKILFAILSLSLVSCAVEGLESTLDDNSSNTNNTNNPNNTATFTDAIPLNTGNYWTYDVVGLANTRDSLYIFGDEIVGANTYKKFKNRNNIATGFYCTSLNNNNVRKDAGKLLLTGNLSVLQGITLPTGVDLSVTDFIIFKESATNGEILSEKTGTFQQTISNFPVTIEYRLRSIGGESFTSFTSPINDVYPNVKSTKIVVNLKISSTQTIAGFPVTINILPQQDVVVSTQYLSRNIGIVYTKTNTNFSLNPTIATQIGLPVSNSQIQEEFLDTYNVN